MTNEKEKGGEEEKEEEKEVEETATTTTTTTPEKEGVSSIKEGRSSEEEASLQHRRMNVDVATKNRINESIKRERAKPNSIVFPAGAILLVDDFEVIDERDTLLTAAASTRRRRQTQPRGGGGGGGGGDTRQSGDDQNEFRRHTLQTYRILSQLFSSISNHFHLHVIAIAHSQNLSGSASGQLSHLARLVKNSISTYTIFLSLANREKKNLLLNHISGADYAAVRQLMQVAAREGNNEREAEEQNDQRHPAITFDFNPRAMNFREENTAPAMDDRDNAVTVPLSFLDHAYLASTQRGQNYAHHPHHHHHPLFSQLERRENRI